MYEPDTILELKEQQPPDDETGEEFAYNRVRVVGQSPINHGVKSEEWVGASGQGVIIVPLSNHGSTLDEPYGKLTKLYNVVEVPVREAPVQAPVRVINSTSGSAGPTPEEVFAEKAPGTPSPDGKRGRTSPLPEVENETPRSPLDAKPKARAKRGA